jgi:ribosomal-protein-serine acetyltransferase
MFKHRVDGQTELQLIQHPQCRELFQVMEANREHLRSWHPWIDLIRSASDLDRFIGKWLQQHSCKRGFHAGIRHEGALCGVINHLNVDRANRSAVLSYWLDEAHQGQGIMTAACRAFVAHAFETLKLNRLTIECATENTRSRRIPERLGFKLEGIIRDSEWLHDHFADHAIYGLLKADRSSEDLRSAASLPQETPVNRNCDRVPVENLK